MEEKNLKIRSRFAPSPTGYLHVGSLRTALYAYLHAKKNGGDFLLRIEDTDQKRYVEGSAEYLVNSLLWAGIRWQEGLFPTNKEPNEKQSVRYPKLNEVGKYGPYVQSERLEIYQKYARELIDSKKAYYCFCDGERLAQMREQQTAEKKPPMYDRHCLSLEATEITRRLNSGEPHVIRLLVQRGRTIVIEDLIRGKVSFQTDTVDDQVLLKSDGFPTYHLASIVDDHLMKITDVIRAEEWLPSTPKHVLLYEAFGWSMPRFAHLPLLLNDKRAKLSKRHGDVAVGDYVNKGYLKEAIVNFVALLGWHPGSGSNQEIFSLEELERVFDIRKVHKAGAVFDIKKLDWINSHYIKHLPIDELTKITVPFLEKKEWFARLSQQQKSPVFLSKVLTVEQDRLAKLADAGEANPFFFFAPEVEPSMLAWKTQTLTEVRLSLQRSMDILGDVTESEWTREYLQKILFDAAGDKRGELLWPLRVALTGSKQSPAPFDVAWVIGKNETMQRIQNGVSVLDKWKMV